MASVPHVGETNGYRVDAGGVSVAYVSDHQQPGPDRLDVAPEVLELSVGSTCSSTTPSTTPTTSPARRPGATARSGSTVAVAAAAGAKRLALFHHDPAHDDAALEALLDQARSAAEGTSVTEVILAAEGLSVALGGSRQPGRMVAEAGAASA